MTIVTAVIPRKGTLVVRGTAADNGEIRRVVVSGVEAKATADNFSQWEVELPADVARIAAHAEDASGNVEQLVHQVMLTDSRITGGSAPVGQAAVGR